MKLLIEEAECLQLVGSFNSAATASDFMEQHVVDLVFLDIQMPGITGIEFARTISKRTLVIFTTAYTEYALDSYEVDAIDYLIKPVEAERFQKAVEKAQSYHSLLLQEEKEAIETIVAAEYFFVKAERRYFKVNFSDILFVEGGFGLKRKGSLRIGRSALRGAFDEDGDACERLTLLGFHGSGHGLALGEDLSRRQHQEDENSPPPRFSGGLRIGS